MAEGEGIRADRTRRRRKWLLLGAWIGVVAAIDIALRMFARHPGPALPVYPPAIAIAAAIGVPILAAAFAWAGFRMEDELGYRNNVEAFAIAYLAQFLGFLAWWILWLGGLAREPNAALLFIGSAAVCTVAFLWLKLRR